MKFELIKGDTSNQYNVARVAQSDFKIQSLEKPVYLYRGDPADFSGDVDMEEPVDDAKHKDDPKEPEERKKKRKTKVYHQTSNWQERSRQRHRQYYPYLLTDDNTVQLIGKVEPQPKTAQYVLFMYDAEGQFSVVPIEEHYKFHSKLNYRTLTMEESESRSKDKTTNRWLMHQLSTGQEVKQEDQLEVKKLKKKEKLIKVQDDEQLYEETFQDDE